MICIRKATKVEGMNLRLRNAVVSDAEFIFTLRTNNKLNRYISPVSNDVQQQIEFLNRYEVKDDEAFFIIENLSGEPLGTVRIYDQRGDSFCWGSWIVSPKASLRTATKSALLIYVYAFDHLGFTSSHFDVRQENERVWHLHESWGAKLTREDETDRYYTLARAAWENVRERYSAMIEKDGPITVEYLA